MAGVYSNIFVAIACILRNEGECIHKRNEFQSIYYSFLHVTRHRRVLPGVAACDRAEDSLLRAHLDVLPAVQDGELALSCCCDVYCDLTDVLTLLIYECVGDCLHSVRDVK